MTQGAIRSRATLGLSAAGWLAIAAGILGAAVLAGYATHSTLLVQLRSRENAAMVISTALSFVLAALAFVLAARWKTVFTLLLLGLNAAVFLENTAALTLDVDFPRQFAWLREPSVHAGRMAPVTNYGFLLFGAALLLLPRVRTPRAGAAVRWLTWGVLAAGVVGVLGYFLRLDLLYSFRELTRMALHSGAGLMLLGLALWLDWRGRRWNRSPEGEQAGRILSAATLALVVVIVAAGFSGLLVVQRMAQRDASTALSLRRQERASYVELLLHQAIARGRAYAAQPALAASLARRGGPPPMLPAQDFSSIDLLRSGTVVARAGRSASGAPVQLPLSLHARLLWEGQFYLEQRLPVARRGRLLGAVVLEQPLQLLGSIGVASATFGKSGEVGLCGLPRPSSPVAQCFPQRLRAQPFLLPLRRDGSQHPMALALQGRTGIADAIDYRGVRVLAAYGPVPGFGLGLVVKMDSRELYAPIRRQIEILLPLLAALAFAGIEMLRWQVRPMVRQLVASRNLAVSSEARFRAAAESGMDPFFIFESVRSRLTGAISDFRLIYANHPGEVFAGFEPARGEALGLSAVPQLAAAPEVRTQLQRVVVERHGWVQEFAIPQDHDPSAPQWLHLQAVPLGDGVAVTLRDISERIWEQERLLVMAQTDTLTGLANRRAFHKRLAHAMESSQRLRRQGLLAVLYLDVDHFKQINDTLGHAAGDQVLLTLGARLLRAVRSADTVARLGGDEFAILLENLDGAHDAERVIEAIFSALHEPVLTDPYRIQISTSIGVAYYRGGETGGPASSQLTSDDLLRRADRALYAAKHAGRNTWRADAG